MNAELLLQHFDRLGEAPDAIPRLRRFILDLAVRGKLVEQDPNDEPAAELLKRIQVEKDRLGLTPRRQGAKKSEKADEESLGDLAAWREMLFLIPESWVCVCLGDVAQYGIPDKVNSNQEITPDTWVLDLEDIEKNTSRLIDQVMSSDRPFRSTKTMFRQRDVLFGKLRPYLNKVVIADTDGVCSTEIVPIRGYCGIVPEYTKLVLKSPLTMQRVDRLMYGMKMPRLGTNDAVALAFPLPPLAEQHRIVAKVDELMALCDQLEAAKTEREQSRDRLVAASLQQLQDSYGFTPRYQGAKKDKKAKQENLGTLAPWRESVFLQNLPRLTTRPAHIKQLRQTILNLAVRGKLVPQDPNDEPVSELFKRIQAEKSQMEKQGALKSRKNLPSQSIEASYELPPTWRWERLGNLINLMDAGWSPQCENHSRRDPEMWGVLKTTAVQALAFDSAQHKELPAKFDPRLNYEARVGDILITRAGPKNRVGISCVVNVVEPRLMISDKLIRFHLLLDLKPDFFALALNAGYSNQCIEDAKSGMAVMQMNISQDKLKLIPVPVAPVEEQRRIVAKVEVLIALCDQLEAQLTITQTDSRRLLEAVLHEALAPALEEVA